MATNAGNVIYKIYAHTADTHAVNVYTGSDRNRASETANFWDERVNVSWFEQRGEETKFVFGPDFQVQLSSEDPIVDGMLAPGTPQYLNIIEAIQLRDEKQAQLVGDLYSYKLAKA